MIPVRARMAAKGITLKGLARELGVADVTLRHYLARRWTKVGRGRKRQIRQALILKGLIDPPKLRPKCICPTCGKTHVRGPIKVHTP